MSNVTHIEHVIESLKNPRDSQTIPEFPVWERNSIVAYLRPVPSILKGVASTDPYLMAEWRNLSRDAFFTSFNSTGDSTRNWLSEKYSRNSQDIIFMLQDAARIPFGHVALYNFENGGTTCEFGRVLRGPGLGPNGGMTIGSLGVLLWAALELRVDRFLLEVFDNNTNAIRLYERLGFRGTCTVPLSRREANGIVIWEKVATSNPETADRFALRMEVAKNELLASHSEVRADSLLHFRLG